MQALLKHEWLWQMLVGFAQPGPCAQHSVQSQVLPSPKQAYHKEGRGPHREESMEVPGIWQKFITLRQENPDL